jgi:purine nucleosidase
MKTKILLDTDIGSDIDDAVCLAYLLSQPECDLLGITTVTGEARQRAMMASALCKVVNKEVPIYPGSENPLLIPAIQTEAPQAKALKNWDHDTRFPDGEAVEFMRKTIRNHPGEIILLTIGPLTNIGLLFSVDPEAATLLKGIVLMCGLFNFQRGAGPVEWNAALDPHAAAIVYRSPVKIHRSIGFEITTQVTMPADEVKEKFSSEILKPVLDFSRYWFETSDRITFHDPLAAATIFNDQICRYERGTADVEIFSTQVRGMTHWIRDEINGRHEVAHSVDPDKFFEHFFSVF